MYLQQRVQRFYVQGCRLLRKGGSHGGRLAKMLVMPRRDLRLLNRQ